MIVNLLKLILLSDFGQRSQDLFAELTAFFGKLLLDFKQIPVRSNTVEQAVEEFVEVISQAVSYKDNVISECNLIL